MMKVAPIPSTSGIMADWLIRTMLPKLRKFGLMTLMIAQSSSRTITGAQDAMRQRRSLGLRVSVGEGTVVELFRVWTLSRSDAD
ncbi:MAG: hypothetical protein WBX21_10105 [Aestuariivirga sp.]